MKVKCKKKPVNVKFKRKTTNGPKNCRWMTRVTVSHTNKTDDFTSLLVKTRVGEATDRSIASLSAWRDKSMDRSAMTRKGINRFFYLHTTKGVEVRNEDGELCDYKVGDTVSVRFSVVFVDDKVHLALECIIVH